MARLGCAALALCLGLVRAQPQNNECSGVGDVHALGFNTNNVDFQDNAALYDVVKFDPSFSFERVQVRTYFAAAFYGRSAALQQSAACTCR